MPFNKIETKPVKSQEPKKHYKVQVLPKVIEGAMVSRNVPRFLVLFRAFSEVARPHSPPESGQTHHAPVARLFRMLLLGEQQSDVARLGKKTPHTGEKALSQVSRWFQRCIITLYDLGVQMFSYLPPTLPSNHGSGSMALTGRQVSSCAGSNRGSGSRP